MATETHEQSHIDCQKEANRRKERVTCSCGAVFWPDLSATQQRILDALPPDGWRSARSVADSLKLPPGTVGARLLDLLRMGRVRRQDGPPSAFAKTYVWQRVA